MATTSVMRDKALALAAEGFPIIQLYSIGPYGQCNCGAWHKKHNKCNPGKHPATEHGYNSATMDPKKIRRWFIRPRNIGIATGPARLIAFDPDTRNGGHIVFAALASELGPLPPTRSFQSGSWDVRSLYRLPDGVYIRTAEVTRGEDRLDIIAEMGGLVVAGIHHSGNPYIDQGGKLAELPPEWASYLQQHYSIYSSLTHTKDYSRLGGEGEKKERQSWDVGDFDYQAACWLWSQLRPGQPFPAVGEAVRCLFHDDGESPDSGFILDRKGYVKFHCFHEQKSYAMTDLYAILLLTEEAPKGATALAKMRDRLYLASGAVQRPEVLSDPPPEWLSDDAGRVYVDLIDMLALNWVSFPGQPVMYTGNYGASRLGLHRDAVYKALWQLEMGGLIVCMGKTGSPSAKLWTTNAELMKQTTSIKESTNEDLLCPCGCLEVLALRGGKPVKWASPGCKQRAWRAKQELI